MDDCAVPSRRLQLSGDDTRRPVRQPVVNGNHERVFEELRQEEQRQQQEAGGGQVGSTGAPGDGRTLTHDLRQVVVLVTFHGFL